MTNFRDICRGLEQAQAARRTMEAGDASATLAQLARDEATRTAMGRSGMAWHQRNRGATERTVALLLARLQSTR
jgi:3-deoxy-D-manno-octulosonic-acid transferase